MRPARLAAFAAVVVTPLALAFAGCTFGLGEYPVGPDALGIEDASSEGSSDGSWSPSVGERDGAAEQDGAPAVGPCVDSIKSYPCTVPDSDAGDAGICSGTQKCTLGAWGACVVSRTCPGTWTESSSVECRKTQVLGDSPIWTEGPMVGSDAVLWSVDRVTSFDTYGQDDQFCFIPKQTGNCTATAAAALEVICTNNQIKLSGNTFEDGSIHNTRYCVGHSGPSCAVMDKAHLVWSSGAIPCERSFVSAAFTISAAPRCTSW